MKHLCHHLWMNRTSYPWLQTVLELFLYIFNIPHIIKNNTIKDVLVTFLMVFINILEVWGFGSFNEIPGALLPILDEIYDLNDTFNDYGKHNFLWWFIEMIYGIEYLILYIFYTLTCFLLRLVIFALNNKLYISHGIRLLVKYLKRNDKKTKRTDHIQGIHTYWKIETHKDYKKNKAEKEALEKELTSNVNNYDLMIISLNALNKIAQLFALEAYVLTKGSVYLFVTLYETLINTDYDSMQFGHGADVDAIIYLFRELPSWKKDKFHQILIDYINDLDNYLKKNQIVRIYDENGKLKRTYYYQKMNGLSRNQIFLNRIHGINSAITLSNHTNLSNIRSYLSKNLFFKDNGKPCHFNLLRIKSDWYCEENGETTIVKAEHLDLSLPITPSGLSDFDEISRMCEQKKLNGFLYQDTLLTYTDDLRRMIKANRDPARTSKNISRYYKLQQLLKKYRSEFEKVEKQKNVQLNEIFMEESNTLWIEHWIFIHCCSVLLANVLLEGYLTIIAEYFNNSISNFVIMNMMVLLIFRISLDVPNSSLMILQAMLGVWMNFNLIILIYVEWGYNASLTYTYCLNILLRFYLWFLF